MISSTDELQEFKALPLLVKSSVRTALRDAVAWRIGGGAAPSPAAFTAAAVAAARLRLDLAPRRSATFSRTLALVGRTAQNFATSPLCRRLLTLPPAQFLRLPTGIHGPDVVVRDRRGRLHAIVLTAQADAFEAGKIASDVALATPLPVVNRLTPLTVHVYCVATAQRNVFERDVAPEQRAWRSRVA